MKVKVEKWIIDKDVCFKILKIDKCCDKLINSNYLNINDYYEDDYTVKMHREEIYGNCDICEDYYETINFCPYCGSNIIIEIVNTIDKTEQYNALKKERIMLWNKCCKTDSKKEEGMLKEQVKEMDNKINYMLMSDDFEDYLGRE